jgi:hypothetical protein
VLDAAFAAIRGEDHLLLRDAEARSELPVALVVGRHGHDGAGAIAHQYEVGRVDRHVLTRHRVHGIEAERQALLLHGLELGLGGAALPALLDEGGKRGILRRGLERQRVLGGDGDVGHTEQGVGARREHCQDGVAPGDAEVELHAL